MPEDFRSQHIVEQACVKGLSEELHLNLDVKSAVILTMWLPALAEYMEDQGLDTVLHVIKDGQDIYIPKEFGSLTKAGFARRYWLDGRARSRPVRCRT